MKNKRVYNITVTALFTAMICVATLISIPLPGNGYANLGDAFIILCGASLGPVYAALAAGLGAALADITLGYTVYAPATFVIKALCAVAVWLVAVFVSGRIKANKYLFISIASVVSELIMIGGYFVFEYFLYGLPTAVADVAGNSVQGLVAIVVGIVLFTVTEKTGLMKKLKK